MLLEIKNNKSLTLHELYNPTICSVPKNSNMQDLPITVFPMVQTVTKTSIITTIFNNECKDYINALATERTHLNKKVAESLQVNPLYQDSRNKGVKLAWKYEKADVTMGGKGSANWNFSERQEILETGKVHQKVVGGTREGPEGHHQKNVAKHPEEQANPDNIKFYKNKEEHLKKGHDGDFKNSTDDEFIDKNKMLKRTNTKRVVTNELLSSGIAAVIGFSTGFTLSFVTELARVGISSVNVSDVIFNSGKSGLEQGVFSLSIYSSGRVASYAMQKIGIDVLTKTGAIINMAAIGIMSIAIISAYQCVKLHMHKELNEESLSQIGKQTAFSLSILTASIIAQGIWGGSIGVIIYTSFGLLFLSKNIKESIHNRKIEEKIRVYLIEQYKCIVLEGI